MSKYDPLSVSYTVLSGRSIEIVNCLTRKTIIFNQIGNWQAVLENVEGNQWTLC